MVVDLVALVIFWINALPPSPSVGGKLGPRQTITGLTINYTKHFRLQFGKYAQFQEFNNNTMQERTTGSIYLRPTGNSQGAYFFMILTTVRILNRKSFTPLPLPQDVINGVYRLARRNPRGPNICERGLCLLLELSTGLTMTMTTPPTLRQTTTTATTTTKATTMRVMEMTTSTCTRPLTKKCHRGP